jgi:hypothetical protein
MWDIVRQHGPGKKAGLTDGVLAPHEALRNRMTQLSEIYNQRILELSANIAGAERLADADATATAHSKLCGSTVTVDLKVEGDAEPRPDLEGLLGQAAARRWAAILGTSALSREVGSAARC